MISKIARHLVKLGTPSNLAWDSHFRELSKLRETPLRRDSHAWGVVNILKLLPAFGAPLTHLRSKPHNTSLPGHHNQHHKGPQNSACFRYQFDTATSTSNPIRQNMSSCAPPLPTQPAYTAASQATANVNFMDDAGEGIEEHQRLSANSELNVDGALPATKPVQAATQLLAKQWLKWAQSALNFDDVPTAVKNLRLALRELGDE
ncbi:hypothetical protein PEBR_15230 [Penicillium brasilianum]|uniref:Vta1 C-terminal domain-containing protein n=1 Tax=Penicillium brasilianum TaxID=104259 RepID=A0A1S9RQZ1_PENBI|nr:hypothetical protein PEBR_15230 [Penicillium brasilianum]